jgi:hypothetical protein
MSENSKEKNKRNNFNKNISNYYYSNLFSNE